MVSLTSVLQGMYLKPIAFTSGLNALIFLVSALIMSFEIFATDYYDLADRCVPKLFPIPIVSFSLAGTWVCFCVWCYFFDRLGAVQRARNNFTAPSVAFPQPQPQPQQYSQNHSQQQYVPQYAYPAAVPIRSPQQERSSGHYQAPVSPIPLVHYPALPGESPASSPAQGSSQQTGEHFVQQSGQFPVQYPQHPQPQHPQPQQPYSNNFPNHINNNPDGVYANGPKVDSDCEELRGWAANGLDTRLENTQSDQIRIVILIAINVVSAFLLTFFTAQALPQLDACMSLDADLWPFIAFVLMVSAFGSLISSFLFFLTRPKIGCLDTQTFRYLWSIYLFSIAGAFVWVMVPFSPNSREVAQQQPTLNLQTNHPHNNGYPPLGMENNPQYGPSDQMNGYGYADVHA